MVLAGDAASSTREASKADLPFMASLHRDALPHGFFVRLGPRFLRTYYATFIDSPYARALIATVRGHSVGMLVGILEPASHTRWVLRRRGLQLALQGAASLAVRPVAAVTFARTRLVRYGAAWRRHRGTAENTEHERAPTARQHPPAVLSHVAVSPSARGAGVGAELVRRFEAAAAGAGRGWVVLLTLEGADGAGRFYQGLGWEHGGRRQSFDGPPMVEWSKTLRGNQA